MNYLPDKVQRTIIRQFGRTVRDACITFSKCPYSFLNAAINTDLFFTFENDYTLHSQSPNCIANEFIKVSNKNILSIEEFLEQNQILYTDIKIERQIESVVGYWMGFVIMQWAIKENFPLEIQKFNTKKLYLSYDVLHTQDINYVIQIIKEEYL